MIILHIPLLVFVSIFTFFWLNIKLDPTTTPIYIIWYQIKLCESFGFSHVLGEVGKKKNEALPKRVRKIRFLCCFKSVLSTLSERLSGSFFLQNESLRYYKFNCKVAHFVIFFSFICWTAWNCQNLRTLVKIVFVNKILNLFAQCQVKDSHDILVSLWM